MICYNRQILKEDSAAVMLTVLSLDAAGGNLALQKYTDQSSNYNSGVLASRVVDGNTNTNWYSGSCTTTHVDVNPWWTVDLGHNYHVTTVLMYNRGLCCRKYESG
jgi:hypothetical protein